MTSDIADQIRKTLKKNKEYYQQQLKELNYKQTNSKVSLMSKEMEQILEVLETIITTLRDIDRSVEELECLGWGGEGEHSQKLRTALETVELLRAGFNIAKPTDIPITPPPPTI